MVELALNAGLRVAEMASLTHGSMLIDGTRSSIRVVGKGNKKRTVWISADFKKICLLYFRLKTFFGLSTDNDSPLLCAASGRAICKRVLQKSFKQLTAVAGLSDHYAIHSLRHTYSTFLLRASLHNYRFVQRQLGHASIRTTQVYAGVLESEGRKALEQLYA